VSADEALEDGRTIKPMRMRIFSSRYTTAPQDKNRLSRYSSWYQPHYEKEISATRESVLRLPTTFSLEKKVENLLERSEILL